MGERLRSVLPSLLSIALALALGFLAIALTRDPGTALEAYGQMFFGGLGDWPKWLEGGPLTLLTRPWGEAGTKAALLMLTGLSVAVAFSVGLFNIGAQGQMMVGALLSAVVGAQLSLPAALHLPLALLAGAVGGALYALIPAALKLSRGVHEVITTIMLNWVAVSLIDNWLVVGPLRAGASGELSRAGTEEVLASAHLPRLLGTLSRLNLGLPLALFAVFCVWAWLLRTRVGFETRAVGQGAEAARAAGIPVARRVAEAMALAGALAGLAGGVLVLGTEFKYPSSLGAPYGFDGIAIALLGGGHPVGTGAAALFFGALRAGGTRMQLLGVHKSFPELIQGFALLLVAGRLAWLALVRRRAPKAQEVPRA
jgi:general nucleoside transport system permease protein